MLSTTGQRNDQQASTVPMGLRVAGVFWTVYGAYILIYSWFYPADLTIVNIGPPMFCIGYGVSLYHAFRSAVWLGWATVLVLIGGGVVTGLAASAPWVIFVGLQGVLALYTTAVRRRLNGG